MLSLPGCQTDWFEYSERSRLQRYQGSLPCCVVNCAADLWMREVTPDDLPCLYQSFKSCCDVGSLSVPVSACLNNSFPLKEMFVTSF